VLLGHQISFPNGIVRFYLLLCVQKLRTSETIGNYVSLHATSQLLCFIVECVKHFEAKSCLHWY